METKKNAEKKRAAPPLSKPATPADIVDKARQYGPLAIEVLVQVARAEREVDGKVVPDAGTSAAARVSAANALLERGYGKAGQPVEVTGRDGGPLPVELDISPAIAAALAKIREITE